MQQPPPIERSSASLHPARPPAQPLAFRLLLTSSRDAKEYRGLYKRIILDKYSLLLNDEEEEYITRGLGKIAAKRKGRKEGKKESTSALQAKQKTRHLYIYCHYVWPVVI
jgi:hypothetical protein